MIMLNELHFKIIFILSLVSIFQIIIKYYEVLFSVFVFSDAVFCNFVNYYSYNGKNFTFNMEIKNICVFCSSSTKIASVFLDDANILGIELAKRNLRLIYGGASLGSMGVVASAVLERGGDVTGIMPKILNTKEVANRKVRNFIVTDNMHERKYKMQELADAFIILPGGFGTLEEAFEVITHKQIGIHNKPIIIVNINGFYDNMIAQLQTIYKEKFASRNTEEIYKIVDNSTEAIETIVNGE